jgi:hypothetical protein
MVVVTHFSCSSLTSVAIGLDLLPKCGRWLVDQRYQMESGMASQNTDPPVFEALVQNSPTIQVAYTKDGTFENAPTPKS